MRSSVAKKTAGLLAALMLLSAMLPVLAFASQVWFKNVSYQYGTLKGEVYVSKSVYEDVYNNKFNLQIVANNGDVTTTDATYTVSDSTYAYYSFSTTVTGATYLDLLAYQYNKNSVGDDTYGFKSDVYRVDDSTPRDDDNEGRRGGGGGGGFIPSNDNISEAQLASQFANGKLATFTITGDSATLPASALANAPAGAVVIIKNAVGSYELPVSVLDFTALAEELGVKLEDLKIIVKIASVTGDAAAAYEEAVKSFGGAAIGSAVDFSVSAEGNGKTVVIGDFGSTYVTRTISNVNANSNATGVLYDPATGDISFIPAVFANSEATLKSTTNSIYAVVEFDLSFADVAGHWSQKAVETIANKLIVEGYENGSFGPDGNITRAEFATIVVRALGLNGKAAAEADFSDVKASDWFAGAVDLAVDAGIVNGYEDGTFRPNAQITREELAAMVVRASAYAGAELSVPNAATVLRAFSDANSIVWANKEIAAAVKAGIIEGFEDGTVRAGNTATRAESVTMIQRFLVNAKFINE